jgi:hypothetical protein
MRGEYGNSIVVIRPSRYHAPDRARHPRPLTARRMTRPARTSPARLPHNPFFWKFGGQVHHFFKRYYRRSLTRVGRMFYWLTRLKFNMILKAVYAFRSRNPLLCQGLVEPL